MLRNLKTYACCSEHSVVLCHVFSKCAPLEYQSYRVVVCTQQINHAGADAGFRVRGGAMQWRIQGGAVHFRSDIRKVGGGVESASGQVRYLCLAHRKDLHAPTYVLPRYTSHERANELKIHAGVAGDNDSRIN